MGIVGVRAKFNQPGLGQTSAHIPGEKIRLFLVNTAGNDGDDGLSLKFLKNGQSQLVIAGVTIVEGNQNGLFWQRFSGDKLAGKNTGIPMV